MKHALAEKRTQTILALCYIVFTVVVLVSSLGCDHIDLYCDHGNNLGSIPPAIYRVVMCFAIPYWMMLGIFLIITTLPLILLGFLLPGNYSDLIFCAPSCVISVLAAIYLFRGKFYWQKILIFLCHIAHAWMLYHYGFPVAMSV